MRLREALGKRENYVGAIRHPLFTLKKLFGIAHAYHFDAYVDRYCAAVLKVARDRPVPNLITGSISAVFGDSDRRREAEIFRRHGSDKSAKHDYYLVYSRLIEAFVARPSKLVEVGLGTNNVTIKSSMGLYGTPGASLRAFRELLPQARIYGGDIDRNILFQEDRISTSFVDQTDPTTLRDFARWCGDGIDLFIDDGLHEPDGNFSTAAAMLDRLAPDGVYVCEDILERYLGLWIAFAALLPHRQCYLLKSSSRDSEHIFVSAPRQLHEWTPPELPDREAGS